MKSKTKDKTPAPTPTPEDALEPDPFVNDLRNVGIDGPYLAKKAKRELNAKITKAQIPKGGDEFVYSKPMVAWDVRQKARQDIHRLKGDYPVEKHEHTLTVEDRLRKIHEKRRQNPGN